MKALMRILCLGFIFGGIDYATAQDYRDLARYSQEFPQGTARTAATGNAFGAVGADFGALNINPAGLGLYRRPEFTMTMNLNSQNSTTTYLDKATPDNRYNFNIGNLGLVLADTRTAEGKPVENGWVSVNFAIGFNRTNNFSSNTTSQAVNANSSLLDFFAADATGQNATPHNLGGYGYLAYQSYLIDPLSMDTVNHRGDSTHYIGANKYESRPYNLKQTDVISTHGSTNKINFTLGANYSNKLYLGATVAVPTIAFHSTRVTTETNLDANPAYYKSSQLTETLNTSGLGITGSLGAIYRVADFLRLGASLQLPTYYSLTDDYTTELMGSTGTGTYTVNPDPGNYHYSIITPMKETVSGAILIGHEGFISADYEFVNYSTARINTTFGTTGGPSSTDINQAARTSLQSTGNLRVGAEYRVDKVSFRLGYQMIGSPYSSGTPLMVSGYDGSTTIYSGGVGLRTDNYFLDFTYFLQKDQYSVNVYNIDNDYNLSYVKSNRSNFMVTIGSKF